MLILTNAGTDKLQIDTSTAANLECHVSWVDVIVGTSSTPGRTNTAIASAANDQDILATPASGTQRVVKHINIRNKHASLSCDVTVVYDQNGTDFELHKATLLAGEVLEYQEGIGWFVLAATSTTTGISYTKLTAASATSTTTAMGDVGLSFAVASGEYYFYTFFLPHRTAATTTGLKVSLTIPTATVFSAMVTVWSSAADATGAAFHGRITSSDDAVTGTGTETTTVDTPARIEGIIVPSANGTLAARYATEVSTSTVTISQGAMGILQKLP